jgi:hypothetical protein
MKKLGLSLCFFLVVVQFSCNNQRQYYYDLDILRLDSLYLTDVQNASFHDYSQQYGYFWDLYSQEVISLPEAYFQDSLLAFQQEEDFQKPYQQLSEQFADFSTYKKGFSEAFYHYNQSFPSRVVPKIITFFGGFNYIAIATDSVLGIGLEMFLGNDANYYKKLSQKFPLYMHYRFKPSHMVALSIDGWLESEFSVLHTDFLSQMIHYGKLKYALSQFMKDTPKHIIMGYSKEQLDWCENSEFSIWKFLIKEGLLYSTDQFLINKYIKPAPYSKGMPLESPGQVAVWVGWNIVEEFMNNNPNVSTRDLFQLHDAQYILNESKYKPR